MTLYKNDVFFGHLVPTTNYYLLQDSSVFKDKSQLNRPPAITTLYIKPSGGNWPTN